MIISYSPFSVSLDDNSLTTAFEDVSQPHRNNVKNNSRLEFLKINTIEAIKSHYFQRFRIALKFPIAMSI